MESIENVVNDIGDTFKGIFTGGASFSEMTTGKKIAVVLVAGLVVLAIVALIYYLYTVIFGFGTSRNVGPAGCCGRSQGIVRLGELDTTLSDQDLQQASNARIMSGMPYIRDMFPGTLEEGQGPLGMYDNTMGFTATKPTADENSAKSDGPCCGQAMVRPQVPYSLNMRPSYSEADFVNMAYSN